MFWTACAGLVWAMLLLDAASGRDNLVTRAGAHLDAAHRDRLADLAVGEHLDRALAQVNEPRLGQRLRRDLARHTGEIGERDNLVLHAEHVGEAALRNAARERHLTALETRFAPPRPAVTRTRHASLVTLTRGLAQSGARATPEPATVPVRTRGRRQIVQTDLFL